MVTQPRLLLAFLAYRYRYLLGFTVIGLGSIILELLVIRLLAPRGWPWVGQSALGFCFGLVFSLALNALVNFRVPRRYLLQTSGWFVLISLLSFWLNVAAISLLTGVADLSYGPTRLITSGALFLIAYALHRRLAFSRAKEFGIAVYANEGPPMHEAYERVGPFCDHVHVDLVDETFRPDASAVDLERIRAARELWGRVPLCLHIMSRRPLRWIEATWDLVDWYLIHPDGDEPALDVIFACRAKGKKVGVVWHQAAPIHLTMRCLPYVDLVMVLGVSQPGHSGQELASQAIEAVSVLDQLRDRFGYQIIFDGGVTTANVSDIPAKYIVSASAVLTSDHPVQAIVKIKTGGRHG